MQVVLEAEQLLGAVADGLVTQVVDHPHDVVDGAQVHAALTREHAQRYREVLLALLGAEPVRRRAARAHPCGR